MRIEQLEHFLSICEEKTFAKASERLHIAPQTLSNSIKNLESTLNAQLFIRNKKGVELTYKGELAQKYFTEIMQSYHAFLGEINDTPKVQTQLEIKLGVVYTVEFNLLPELQCAMMLTHPHIALEIISKPILDVIEDVQNDSIDIGIVAGRYTNDVLMLPQIPTPAINIVPLREWSLYVWVGENCSLSKKSHIHISTIEQYPILIYSKTQDTFKNDFLHSYLGKEFRIQAHDNIKTISRLVESTSNLFFDWHCDNYGLDYELYFKDKKVKAIPVILDETIKLKTIAIFKDTFKQHPAYQDFMNTLKSTSK